MTDVSRAVLAAGVAGQVSAATVGALPWPLLLLTLPLYVGGGLLAVGATGARATALRHTGSVVALAGVAVGLVSLPLPLEPVGLKASLGLVLVGAQAGQAMGWRTVRDLRSGLATALGLLVLGASYAPDVLVGLPLLVGWAAALVALARLRGARPVLPATAVSVVLGLVAFLLVPAPVSAGLRSRLSGIPDLAGRGALGAPVFTGEELDLRRRGSLGSDAVALVPADSPELWRAATFDRYDGTTWTRPSSRVLDGGPDYVVATPDGPTRDYAVDLRGAADGTVWSPGALIGVRTASNVRIPLANELGDVSLPGVRGGYTVTAQLPETDPARLRSTVGGDAPEVRWRVLPRSLPPRVTQLAQQLTAGAGSRWEAAESVADWLRANATYQLDSPVPRSGEDAVDRFLFVDRRGFCEQFASAEVVLLRAVGIPARLVTGMAYGVRADGGRLFRVKDAHAWVELWVPGVGWAPSDPTAGVPLAEGSAATGPGLRARLDKALTSALHALTEVPGGRTSLALGLLVLTAVGGVVRGRLPARRVAVPGVAIVGGPALQAFLRMDARLGPRRRRQGESLRELSLRLDPEVREALQVVEQECYAPTAPDPRAAVEVLDRY